MNKIYEAYQNNVKPKKINEAASRGEIDSLYLELYKFIGRYNITDLKGAGEAIGTQAKRALTKAFDVASNHDKAEFKNGVTKAIK